MKSLNIHQPWEAVKSVLLGVAVGDALGVPVEFKSRKTISLKPITGMTGYGTYGLPPGTWSDDSSLTFCLAEALTHDFDIKRIGDYMVKWYRENFWTAGGTVFDVGSATSSAIRQLERGADPVLAGGSDEASNGNGSLMRIAPLMFYLSDKPVIERFEIVRQVSSITHRHIRSVIACFYYLEFALLLIEGKTKLQAYETLKVTVSEFLRSVSVNAEEILYFDRLLNQDIYKFAEEQIQSSGYVIHTLEAAIWCFLTTESYKEAVLRAVNLGEDTDTTATITGGLAGLFYGINSIPRIWLNKISRLDDIESLSARLAQKISMDHTRRTI